ncbi:MAG: AgmX/PglI C-terminal domain-containing protein [Gemmatimonadota bacterium]
MQGRIRIAIACAGMLATSAVVVRAQSTYRETGSVTVGGYIVWVRGTNAKTVELFVGRGFRDAFARPHEMDAARLQQWIDSVRAVAPLPADDSSSTDMRLRGAVVGTDVTMVRRVGGPFSGLRLLVNGEEPITMAEPTARDFIAALDSAVHAASDLTPESRMAHMLPGDAPVAATTVALAAEPATPVLAHVTAPRVAPVPVVATPPIVVAAAVPIPARTPAPTPPPAPVIGVAPPNADSSLTIAVIEPSAVQAPPELVLPMPSERVLVTSRVEIAPTPLPRPAIPAPVVRALPAPEPDSVVVAPHLDSPADKLIHTPLGPFTIPGAMLADRDKQAQYCYSQLGLKYNPDLKGEITVKLAINSDGTVQDAMVTKRNWQGISAGEVEACVRALAKDWTFASTDPAVTGGAKILTFTFAPQVASAP